MPKARSLRDSSSVAVHLFSAACVCIGAQVGALLRQVFSRAFGALNPPCLSIAIDVLG